MNDLAEVFNEVEEGEETGQVEAETPVTETETKVEETETKESEQKEESTETGEKETKTEDSAPESKTEDDQQSVPIQALMAERDKRQKAEQQLADSQANAPKKPAPDVFEDQKAYTDHMQGEFNQAMMNERLNTSEFYASREHPDLQEKVEAFKEIAKENPALAQQVMNAVSPYHEMYDVVQKHETMLEMKDIDGFKEKTKAELREEVRTEILAEMEGKAKEKSDLRDAIPTSLVSEPSKGSVKGATWAGPTTLEDVFNE